MGSQPSPPRLPLDFSGRLGRPSQQIPDSLMREFDCRPRTIRSSRSRNPQLDPTQPSRRISTQQAPFAPCFLALLNLVWVANAIFLQLSLNIRDIHGDILWKTVSMRLSVLQSLIQNLLSFCILRRLPECAGGAGGELAGLRSRCSASI